MAPKIVTILKQAEARQRVIEAARAQVQNSGAEKRSSRAGLLGMSIPHNAPSSHTQISLARARRSRRNSSCHSENYLDQSFLGDFAAWLCFCAPVSPSTLHSLTPIRNLQIQLPRMVSKLSRVLQRQSGDSAHPPCLRGKVMLSFRPRSEGGFETL